MKRKSRLTIALLLGVLALSGCEKKAPNPVGITIKAEGDKQSIKVGETLKFSALVMPEDAVQKVKWTVAPVTGEANITDEGVLTAVKEGNVNVVATSYVDPETRNIANKKDYQIDEGIEIVLTDGEGNPQKTYKLKYCTIEAPEPQEISTGDGAIAKVKFNIHHLNWEFGDAEGNT